MVPYRRLGRRLEFLVLHRVKNWNGWEFPKGGIKSGEKDTDTILRELAEECSCGSGDLLSITPLGYKFSFSYPEEHRKKSGFSGAEFETFAVELSGSAKVSIERNTEREHDAFRWLTEAEAAKIIHPDLVEALRRAAKLIGAGRS